MITIEFMKSIGRVSDAPVHSFDDVSHRKRPILSSNVCTNDDRIIPMPIGVRRYFNVPNGDHGRVCLYCARPITQERWMLQKKFSKYKWVTMLDRFTSNEECLKQMAMHKFIISPYGVGFDCCKTWEALYCGSFPVVKRQYFLEVFAEKLPIVIVDDWNEVTIDFLNHKYDEFQNKEWCYELLTEEYWRNIVIKNRNIN